MADKTGPAPHLLALFRALEDAPHRFGFFAALRRLECAYRDRPRLGQSVRPGDDPVRLGQRASLAFAPSTLAAFETRDDRPPRLEVFFLGLFGPNGPLPTHLSEYARERQRNESDPSFARFADMFHHRLLSLFYRAWAMQRPAVDFDRPESSAYVNYLGALMGIGRPQLRNRDAVADVAKLHYAGRLSCGTRNSEGLAAMLTDYFKLPVQILEFVGAWIAVPHAGVCRLGRSAETSGLGVSVIVGTRLWTGQQKFRIRLGPMGLADYQRFLPRSGSLEKLVAMVRNYLGDELDWDVNLVLKAEEVPPLRLGDRLGLGWSTWTGQRPATGDAADLHLNPLALACQQAGRDERSC